MSKRLMNLCYNGVRLMGKLKMRGFYPKHRMKLMMTQRLRWRRRIFIRISNPILWWSRWSSMESQNTRLKTNRWK